MSLALVINSGSSSLKYGLFRAAGSQVEKVCSGMVDKIGLNGCTVKHEEGEQKQKFSTQLRDHSEAMQKMLDLFTRAGGPVKSKADIKVVGHRVVHGGPKLTEATVIDERVEREIEDCIKLAPLHNPANLLGIRMALKEFMVPNVAVFDTAFHHTMPPESYRYPLPKELFVKHHVRRYGFHGTSYKYCSARVAEILQRPLEELNLIMCHLGSGCSMACLESGRVVDTTMGFTPLEGVMMGTRCGDLDVGVMSFLCEELGKSPREVEMMLNKKSGLLGIAGRSDMREVLEAEGNGDEDAALAREMYVQRVRKYLGSFLVKLNGQVDAIVFTGGVGQNDWSLRERVTEGLDRLGIRMDVARNRALHGEGIVSGASSRVQVMVVSTQEELCIAQQALKTLEDIQPQQLQQEQASEHPCNSGTDAVPATFILPGEAAATRACQY